MNTRKFPVGRLLPLMLAAVFLILAFSATHFPVFAEEAVSETVEPSLPPGGETPLPTDPETGEVWPECLLPDFPEPLAIRPSPPEMLDNSILRALEYTGYDVPWMKANEKLYQYNYYGGRLETNRPQVLSGIRRYNGVPTGGETVADETTITGKAPDIPYFEKNGLVCASFVNYYIANYLPNIEGVDTSIITDTLAAEGTNVQRVLTWQQALEKLTDQGAVEKVGTSMANADFSRMVPGDIIIFGNSTSSHVHIAIYAGRYADGVYNGTNTYIIHVANARGPEISTVKFMESGGDKSSTPNAFYHLSAIFDTGSLEIHKTDPGGKALAGAQFLVTNTVTNEHYTLGPTDGNGYAVLKDIPYGTYTVRETVFPDGFGPGDITEWTVTLDRSTPNGTMTIRAVNNPLDGKLRIVKKMPDGGSTAGWMFRVTDGSGKELPGSPFTTDEDGVILSGKLLPGTYNVEELLPTDSLYFCEGENPRTVTVSAGETASVTFTNRLRPGKIQIRKVDPTGKSLAGAGFLLEWSRDGESWQAVTQSTDGRIVPGGCSSPGLTNGCLVSQEDGLVLFEGLHPGFQYRLTEVEAPPGYQLLTECAFVGELPTEDLTITLTVHNSPGYALPTTGGSGFRWLPLSALLLALAGAFFIPKIKKKDESI